MNTPERRSEDCREFAAGLEAFTLAFLKRFPQHFVQFWWKRWVNPTRRGWFRVEDVVQHEFILPFKGHLPGKQAIGQHRK